MDILTTLNTLLMPGSLGIIIYFIKKVLDKLEALSDAFNKHLVDDAKIASLVNEMYEDHDQLTIEVQKIRDKLPDQLSRLEDKLDRLRDKL